jgi:Transposase zinc-ribbon domain
MARNQPKPIHQLTVAQFERMFPNEDACCAYLVGRRWPDGVRCPRCGAENPYKLPNRPWSWQCYECAPDTSYRFSHIAGTIFENTNKPLRDWYRVVHLMLASKKGMSALQIKRYMGFGSYETAWSMCHKIRVALMQDIDSSAELSRSMKLSSAAWPKTGIGTNAAAVVGRAVSVPIKRRSSAPLAARGASSRAWLRMFRPTLSPPSSAKPYRIESACFAPINTQAITRSTGITHMQLLTMQETNTLSAQSALKRLKASGRYSSAAWSARFHKMSRKYMPLYVAEFQFRYNNRGNADIFGTAIKGC